jgi:hypothetical protein
MSQTLEELEAEVDLAMNDPNLTKHIYHTPANSAEEFDIDAFEERGLRYADEMREIMDSLDKE